MPRTPRTLLKAGAMPRTSRMTARLVAAGLLLGMLGIGTAIATDEAAAPFDPVAAMAEPGDCTAVLNVMLPAHSGAELDAAIDRAGGTDRWLDTERSLFAGTDAQVAAALHATVLNSSPNALWVLVDGDARIAKQLVRLSSASGRTVYAVAGSGRLVDCP